MHVQSADVTAPTGSAWDAQGRITGRLPALDGLRGFALLVVLLVHFGKGLSRQGLLSHILVKISDGGWASIDVFFVLSGFLITGILLDTRKAENYFLSFYVRRVLRIFPVYYLSLLVFFFLLPRLMPGFERVSPPPGHRIWYFAYMQNWIAPLYESGRRELVGHFWSLAVEEQFYLTWPLIVWKSTNRTVLRIAIALSVASVCLRFTLLGMNVQPEVIYDNTFTRMEELLIGAICACLLRDSSCVKALQRCAKWLWIVPLVALAVMSKIIRPFWYTSPGAQGFGFSALALSSAALLIGLVLTTGTRSIPQRFFCSRFLTACGKYSYATYVWHLLVARLVLKVEYALLHTDLPILANLPILIASALAFGFASYILVERPCLAGKDRFKPRFRNTANKGRALTQTV
jgi:peptidoglycan/LPS O-acetylase OafA/YrhL